MPKETGKGYELDWKGDDVVAKAQSAAAHGINRTMADCVTQSKATVHVVTSVLQGSLRIITFAVPGAGEIFGLWGSVDVDYAIWEEIGTQHRPGHPYLRPSADLNYPKLLGHIQEAFRG